MFKTGLTAWVTFAPESRSRRVTRKLIIRAKEYLNKRRKLKSLVKLCLKPFPGLQDRLKRVGKIDKVENIINKKVDVKELNNKVSKENNDLVLNDICEKIATELYRIVLNRNPDINGLKNHTKLLKEKPLVNIVLGMMSSEEFKRKNITLSASNKQDYLSPSARKIYIDLKKAVEERKKDENLN